MSSPQTGTSPGITVARFMTILGLIVQILVLGDEIIGTWDKWSQRLMQVEVPTTIATVVFLGCFALFYPVYRGRRWALLVSVLLQLLLLAAALPFFLYEFPRPAMGFSGWVKITTVILAGAAAAAFGIVAWLEVRGKMAPARLRTPEGGFTGRGTLVLALGAAWAGMVIVAAGASGAVTTGAAPAQAPDTVLFVVLDEYVFAPASLEVKAGETTAVVLTNKGKSSHSFDVAGLNVHVLVPPGKSAVAMLTPRTAGTLDLSCDVPGHKDGGQVGKIHVRP
jgi:uncharacterized cupredoxin-like copper-binding protein